MALKVMTDEELRERATRILIRELGLANSTRFLKLIRPSGHEEEYIEWRQKWLDSIDQEAIVADILQEMKQDFEASAHGE